METIQPEHTLSIDAEVRGEVARLRLIGYVDPSTCGQFHGHAKALLDEGVTRLTVETAGLTFADSSCLNVLIELSNELRERNGELTVEGAPPLLVRLLAVTGLSDVLNIN